MIHRLLLKEVLIVEKKVNFSFIANPMANQIIVTLLKDGISYILRIEYLCNNDKIKETNHEIDKDLVYWIFCNLRVMIDQMIILIIMMNLLI